MSRTNTFSFIHVHLNLLFVKQMSGQYSFFSSVLSLVYGLVVSFELEANLIIYALVVFQIYIKTEFVLLVPCTINTPMNLTFPGKWYCIYSKIQSYQNRICCSVIFKKPFVVIPSIYFDYIQIVSLHICVRFYFENIIP